MKWKKLNMPSDVKKDKNSNDRFATYYIEPLEKGYATTIGNALRRVLLSSIPGAGVVRVKIEGVLTEFSTIPGVREDVTEIILNLKKLRVKLGGDLEEATLKLQVKGPGEVKAADIETPAGVEIVNPDLHIAELNKDGVLDMEIYVNIGRGYVPEEEHEVTDDVPVGYIWMDTLYSPVEKVSFYIENVRVGKRTDLERLILNVWTDGSITPDEAISYAANVLIDHFNLFIFNTIEIEEEEVVEVDEKKEQMKRLLSMKISELELSVRSTNCLKSANIETLADLVKYEEDEILKLKNFGKKSLEEINDVLKRLGLRLGMKKEVEEIMND